MDPLSGDTRTLQTIVLTAIMIKIAFVICSSVIVMMMIMLIIIMVMVMTMMMTMTMMVVVVVVYYSK